MDILEILGTVLAGLVQSQVVSRNNLVAASRLGLPDDHVAGVATAFELASNLVTTVQCLMIRHSVEPPPPEPVEEPIALPSEEPG